MRAVTLGIFAVMGLGCAGAPPTALTVLDTNGVAVYEHRGSLADRGLALSDGANFAGVSLFDSSSNAYQTARFSSGSYRAEADLYAEDPRAILSRWETSPYDPVTLGMLENLRISPAFSIANPVTTPLAPPAGAVTVQFGIFPGVFYPWLVGSPPRHINLSHVLLSNYGRCATEIGLKSSVLAPLVNRIVEGIVDRRRDRSAKAEINSFVTFDDDRPQGGGFLLYISGQVPTIAGSPDVKFKLTRRYSYSLDNGIISVKLDRSQDEASRYECTSSSLSCDALKNRVRDELLTGLDPGLIDSINLEFMNRQSQVIRSLEDGAAECATDRDCPDGVNMASLDLAAGLGAGPLAKVFSMDGAQEAAFRTNVQSQVRSPANWRCVERPDARKSCRFVVRAERLNVFPNALQPVWLTEGSEGSSSGAAITAAAYTDAARVGALCNAQHGVYVDPTTNDRPFERVVASAP
ncbi:hypothetical protein [Sorangium sp. So ce385]|uniref:hypothetical protein n=1 Tax=Sorangium sp. So ce385 TaxID=3133308 RepID=UPI003F5C7517